MNIKHILSIDHIHDSSVDAILNRAEEIKMNGFTDSLDNILVGTAFFESSTRTRLSFEAAVNRCNGKVIGFSDVNSTSTTKGESLEDTIKILSSYVDLIIMRHPESGAAIRAAEVSSVPIINAGDGSNAHPTQTLIDLFAIKQVLKRLDNFTITMVGDLKYSRVAHSLANILTRYKNVKQNWVSPINLKMPNSIKQLTNSTKIEVNELDNYIDVIKETDILLMTRVQKERFKNENEYEKLKDFYILKLEELKQAKPGMKIISPLPRVYEIPVDIDQTPQAYYFQQAADGVPVRAALLEHVLQK